MSEETNVRVSADKIEVLGEVKGVRLYVRRAGTSKAVGFLPKGTYIGLHSTEYKVLKDAADQLKGVRSLVQATIAHGVYGIKVVSEDIAARPGNDIGSLVDKLVAQLGRYEQRVRTLQAQVDGGITAQQNDARLRMQTISNLENALSESRREAYTLDADCASLRGQVNREAELKNQFFAKTQDLRDLLLRATKVQHEVLEVALDG